MKKFKMVIMAIIFVFLGSFYIIVVMMMMFIVMNVAGLSNLATMGSHLAIHNNPNLIDISGLSNVEGFSGKYLYIDLDKYETKANENLKFCTTSLVKILFLLYKK